MSKFALKELTQVAKGPVKFFKLIENKRCPFDDFCTEIKREGNLSGYLNAIYRIMDRVAKGEPLANGMVGSIKGGNKNEFEFRKEDLRVYFIRNSEGHIIISGGKKTNQKKDIEKFQNMHQRFIDNQNGK